MVYGTGSIYLVSGWSDRGHAHQAWLALAHATSGYFALPFIGLYFSVQRWNFFAAWLAQCPKQKMSSPPKLGKSGLLSTWKHYIESTSADFVSIGGEVIHVGQVKSTPARTEEEETDTPSAPRLPTSFQQRQTFMKTRFNPNRVDEQNIG